MYEGSGILIRCTSHIPTAIFLEKLIATFIFAYIPPLSWGGGFLQFSVALHTKMTCAQAINNTITYPKLGFIVCGIYTTAAFNRPQFILLLDR